MAYSFIDPSATNYDVMDDAIARLKAILVTTPDPQCKADLKVVISRLEDFRDGQYQDLKLL